MSRLILHIGTHKTGTTSIQRAIASRRGKLLARGLWYPGYDLIGRANHYAHIGAANGLAGDHRSIGEEQAAQFFRKVAEGADAHEATLLSAESFYRQVLSPIAPQSMADPERYWAARDAYIARVRELVGDAEIVVVFRRQADFAESLYQEHVKVTRYGRDFAAYRAEFWFHFRYRQQYEAWRRHFSAVKVLRFDDLAGENIGRRFLTRLGLRGGGILPDEARNIGLAPDWVVYKRWLNETSLDRDALQKLAEMMAEAPIPRDEGAKRRLFAGAENRRTFQAQFDEDNRALAAVAQIEEIDMFSPIAADTAIYGDDLTLDERATMTAELVAATMRGDGANRGPSDDPAVDQA